MNSANKTKKNGTKRSAETPDSATSAEKTRSDDDAVRAAVTAEDGVKTVLPGPPIPPQVQADLKAASETGAPISERDSSTRNSTKRYGENAMVDPSEIKEHMEVVGSDGDHVGTVDSCEGDNVKLTRNDPAAGGKHHYIPLAWVNMVDQRVHLAHPASEARAQWG